MDKLQVSAIWSGKFLEQTATGSAARSLTRNSRLSAVHKNSYLAQLDLAERAIAAMAPKGGGTSESQSLGQKVNDKPQKKLEEAIRIFLD